MMTPGDIVLLTEPLSPKLGDRFEASSIRIGQRIGVELRRALGRDHTGIPIKLQRAACWCWHALLVASATTCVQADEDGVHEDALWDFGAGALWIDSLDTAADRAEVVAAARSQRRHSYGYLRLATILLRNLTLLPLSIGVDGWFQCAGLVCWAELKGQTGGQPYARDARSMSPATIALHPPYYAQVREQLLAMAERRRSAAPPRG